MLRVATGPSIRAAHQPHWLAASHAAQEILSAARSPRHRAPHAPSCRRGHVLRPRQPDVVRPGSDENLPGNPAAAERGVAYVVQGSVLGEAHSAPVPRSSAAPSRSSTSRSCRRCHGGSPPRWTPSRPTPSLVDSVGHRVEDLERAPPIREGRGSVLGAAYAPHHAVDDEPRLYRRLAGRFWETRRA